MKKNIFILSMVVLVVSAVSPNCQVEYIPFSKAPLAIWKSESLFLGVSAKVVDSNTPVSIIRKTNRPRSNGELYFMTPAAAGSSIFLFHNNKNMYPLECDSIFLGLFPKGTELIFKYVNIDTSISSKGVYNKKLYSGRNTESSNSYISEINGCYGNRWTIAGQVMPSIVEMSFEGSDQCLFQDIRFYIRGATLLK